MLDTARAIQLDTDFPVDPAREQELVDAWRNGWPPRASRTPGVVERRLLGLRRASVGDQSKQLNYHLVQLLESEELRHAGTESPEDALAWPPREKPLLRLPGSRWLFTALLGDEQ